MDHFERSHPLYEFTKYNCDINNVKEKLDEFGVAIIPNILTEKECEESIDGMWNYLEHITSESEHKIKRDDEKTWRNLSKLYPLHSMLIQHWQIGHSQFIWNIRQNPKIVDIFAHIFDVEKDELLVSFDGASIHMPSEITKIGWNRNNIWYHSDQSFTRNDFECVQSWINLFDTNEGDATLSFLEKSHNFHKDFSEISENNTKDDWYKLDETEFEFFILNNCEEKKIKCPKGSLVLWDSRLIHCGTEPYKYREKPNFRGVVYLCYQPRYLCDEKNLKKKLKAFQEKRLTSHWPCKIKLFPKNPRTYGAPLPKIKELEDPKLNELGLKLAGF